MGYKKGCRVFPHISKPFVLVASSCLFMIKIELMRFPVSKKRRKKHIAHNAAPESGAIIFLLSCTNIWPSMQSETDVRRFISRHECSDQSRFVVSASRRKVAARQHDSSCGGFKVPLA